MDDLELRRRLRAILELEAAEPVDWTRVQQLSTDLLPLISQPSESDPPHLVYHYLSDADIRERDTEYADGQREGIRRFVETGEREPLESRSVPAWPCLLVAALLIAAMIWPLF